jgi:3-deoxy-manno-octulosonate cytidylyltransferase (CMP-KDO synthetase)
MSAVGIVPARYQSSRYPGKPIVEIAGLPMLQWVWQGARAAKRLREVYIATDDSRIANCCDNFGAKVIMTREDHHTGTDRLAEAAEVMDDDIIVNIQGDEPLIEGFVVDAVVETLLEDSQNRMATLVHAMGRDQIDDPNRVKVALDRLGNALYFSRSPIPFDRSGPGEATSAQTLWQHIGIYAYRRDFLFEFAALPQTPCELSESLEQLRALENGIPIRTGIVEGWTSDSVDAPEDVLRVEALLAQRRS